MKTITLFMMSILIALMGLTEKVNAGYNAGYILQNDSIIADSTLAESEVPDSLPTEDQQKKVVTKGDTTYISFGNKNIQIIEQDGQTDVKIKDKKTGEEDQEFDEGDFELFDDDEDAEKDFSKKGGKKFKGHWAGFEFGLNNYVDKDFSFSRSTESAFLDLNTGKSWNFNWNFVQYSLGFGSDQIGLVTGMGLEWSNYHFSDTTSIHKQDQTIQPRVFSDEINPDNILKNRLQTTYLTIPLILETQFMGSKRSKRLYAGVGVIGGIKLFSNTKIKYVENGVNQKEKNKDDFYLAPLRYGFTARIGYRALKLYANYYATPLFLDGKHSEDLNPIAAGLVLSF